MNWQKEDLKHIWHPCSQMKDYEELPPIIIEKGKGINLYDIQGKCYKDVVSSWWCNLLGHCNPIISKRLKEQAQQLEHVIFANFSHKPIIELCMRLKKLLPSGLAKFNFSDNGSSSIEMAMKISFQYFQQTGLSEKKRFMALTDAYHGETISALSMGDCDLYTKIYKPILMDVIRIKAPDCYRCPYKKTRDNCQCECFCDCEKQFEKYGKQTAAILVEPLLQGSAGMKIYPALYLKKLRKICDKYNVHLILDEIATGFYRTGRMFACNHANITPDIMCISKGLTGGYMPMAAAITTDKIYNAFYDDYNTYKAFMHSHTYSGNPLGASCALGVLDILETGEIQKHLKEVTPYFNSLIKEHFLNLDYTGEVRSIGLINAIELVKNKITKESFDSKLRIGYQIYKKALQKGVLLRPLGNIIYFNPPLIIDKEDMNYVVKVAKECAIEVLKEQ
ncbi:adenosylmethionine--8-amino-7-oxononanoate transaminase [bacterium]|nr:adenosylmethionine--8-amino-7-oxononanoate transaminase [bacterium]MBQ9150047.1 adenosylmethionine--8-amino-7-oxononanoate transaminase [bacterium]